MATKSRKRTADPVDAEQLYEHLQAVIRDSEALLKASASYAGDKIDVAKAQAAETLAARRSVWRMCRTASWARRASTFSEVISTCARIRGSRSALPRWPDSYSARCCCARETELPDVGISA